MQIVAAQVRPLRQQQQRLVPHMNGSTQMSGPQAEEQFLEQTPWANPQHPIHRLSRQNSNRSPPAHEFLTPANQQRTTETLQPAGSASTIVDPSAQASSALNTPHDPSSAAQPPGPNYSSPMDARRAAPSAATSFQIATDRSETAQQADNLKEMASSPLTSRAQLVSGSSPRANPKFSGLAGNDSPFRHNRDSALTAGSGGGGGFSGTGRFSIR
jgi:hypothetical protein